MFGVAEVKGEGEVGDEPGVVNGSETVCSVAVDDDDGDAEAVACCDELAAAAFAAMDNDVVVDVGCDEVETAAVDETFRFADEAADDEDAVDALKVGFDCARKAARKFARNGLLVVILAVGCEQREVVDETTR